MNNLTRPTFILPLVAAIACGGVVETGSAQRGPAGNTSPPGTEPAPSPTPSPSAVQPAPFCTQPLEVACSNVRCTHDLASAELPSTWCPNTERILVYTCPPYTVVARAGTDESTDYYYDDSGTLVAVVDDTNGRTVCLGGDATFQLPPLTSCDANPYDDICLSDAGHD